MSAEDSFRTGQLDDAIAAQNEAVRKAPLDADARWQLFVLLCHAGDLERAEKQLDVLTTRDADAQRGGLVYRALLASELERRTVFEGKGRPVLPPDAPEHARLRVEALAHLRSGDEAAAAKSVASAVECTPAYAGRLDSRPFDGLCDLDDRFGGVLEVLAGGRYLWLPLESVRRLELAEARSAIDWLWRSAELVDASGETATVFLPTLYPGSAASDEPLARVGRDTETFARGELELARGHRRWLVARGDELEEVPLGAVRLLELGG